MAVNVSELNRMNRLSADMTRRDRMMRRALGADVQAMVKRANGITAMRTFSDVVQRNQFWTSQGAVAAFAGVKPPTNLVTQLNGPALGIAGLSGPSPLFGMRSAVDAVNEMTSMFDTSRSALGMFASQSLVDSAASLGLTAAAARASMGSKILEATSGLTRIAAEPALARTLASVSAAAVYRGFVLPAPDLLRLTDPARSASAYVSSMTAFMKTDRLLAGLVDPQQAFWMTGALRESLAGVPDWNDELRWEELYGQSLEEFIEWARARGLVTGEGLILYLGMLCTALEARDSFLEGQVDTAVAKTALALLLLGALLRRRIWN